MISKLYQILKKNMLILKRSKGFMIGIIFAPLIITALVGMIFSEHNLNSIQIGIVDNSPEMVSKDLLKEIDVMIFELTYHDTVLGCSESIIKGSIHACILFDENFDMDGKKRNTLYLYADYSRINIVWEVINTISHTMSESSESESMDIIKSLLDQISDYDKELDVNSEKISQTLGNVKELRVKVLESSKKLDNVNTLEDNTVSEDVGRLMGQIDSFKETIDAISDEQKTTAESIDAFTSIIQENELRVAIFESQFRDMKNNMTIEKDDCIDLDSYTGRKYTEYRCRNYNLNDTSYDSDTSQTLYLKCREVKNDISENLRTVVDPLQACYIIDITQSMTEEKIIYLDQQIAELNKMIDSTVEIQKDLDESLDNVDDLRASIQNTNDELEKIDSDIEQTSNDLTSISDGIDNMTSSKNNEFNDLKNDLLLDLESITGSIDTNHDDLNSIAYTLSGFDEEGGYNNISAEALASPINVIVKPVTEKKSSFDYVAPLVLAIMIALSAVMISSLLSINEKLSNSIKRNLICPTSDWLFIVGMYLTNMILLFVQMSIFIAVLIYFDAYTPTNLSSLLSAIFITGSAFVLSGMVIASFFKTEQSTIFGSLSFVILIIFFSEIFAPIEKISPDLKMFAIYNPLNMTISLFRKIILFNTDISAGYGTVLTLTIFSIICFANIYILNVITKKG